jgi:exopolysaccharide biosynthesis polyprenyl glycosylphosphotransferase
MGHYSGHLALRAVQLVADGILLIGAALLAFAVQCGFPGVFVRDPLPLPAYLLLAQVALAPWLGLSAAFGLHRTFEGQRTRWATLLGLARLFVVGAPLLALMLTLSSHDGIDGSAFGLYLGCAFALLYAQRLLVDLWSCYQHESGHGRVHLLLVCQSATDIARFVQEARARRLPPRLIGYLDASGADPVGDDAGLDIERLGSISDFARVVGERVVDIAIFWPSVNRPEAIGDALAVCRELGMPAGFVVSAAAELERARPAEARADDLILVRGKASEKPVARAVKQLIDLAGAGLGVVLLCPLLLLVTVAIWVSMGRPILFRQARIGRFGREFQMFKFRSMVRDAEARRSELEAQNEMSGPVFKVTGDPRVTRLGRFLRNTSIDELPQLFNVLLGHMSLVGCRPLPVAEQRAIDGWRRRRLAMKPGITCLWQVSGRNDIDFEEWMALDVQYIDQWSLALDVRLLLQTPMAVVRGKGAR